MVEHNESPLRAAQRKLLEELGLVLRVLGLLVVDHSAPSGGQPESVQWIFDAGTLGPLELARIRLPPTELEAWRFVAPEGLDEFLRPRLAARVRQAIRTALHGQVLYLESQEAPVASDNV